MKLKVISFNIRCMDDKDGHSVKERAPRLRKVIEPYAPDVMGFQEYTPLWESHIEEQFGEEYGPCDDGMDRVRADTLEKG